MTRPNGFVEADLGVTLLNPQRQMRVVLARRNGCVHLQFHEEQRPGVEDPSGRGGHTRVFSVRTDRMAGFIEQILSAEDVAQRRGLIFSKTSKRETEDVG